MVLGDTFDQLIATTIWAFSQGEYSAFISMAIPKGRVSPCDLLIVIAPICFNAYWSLFAWTLPWTDTSLSCAELIYTSDQPCSIKYSLLGGWSNSIFWRPGSPESEKSGRRKCSGGEKLWFLERNSIPREARRPGGLEIWRPGGEKFSFPGGPEARRRRPGGKEIWLFGGPEAQRPGGVKSQVFEGAV